jgi:hypothetical protein
MLLLPGGIRGRVLLRRGKISHIGYALPIQISVYQHIDTLHQGLKGCLFAIPGDTSATFDYHSEGSSDYDLATSAADLSDDEDSISLPDEYRDDLVGIDHYEIESLLIPPTVSNTTSRCRFWK